MSRTTLLVAILLALSVAVCCGKNGKKAATAANKTPKELRCMSGWANGPLTEIKPGFNCGTCSKAGSGKEGDDNVVSCKTCAAGEANIKFYKLKDISGSFNLGLRSGCVSKDQLCLAGWDDDNFTKVSPKFKCGSCQKASPGKNGANVVAVCKTCADGEETNHNDFSVVSSINLGEKGCVKAPKLGRRFIGRRSN